jgi:hypothetical protein
VRPILTLNYASIKVDEHSLGLRSLIMTMLSFAHVEIVLPYFNKL